MLFLVIETEYFRNNVFGVSCFGMNRLVVKNFHLYRWRVRTVINEKKRIIDLIDLLRRDSLDDAAARLEDMMAETVVWERMRAQFKEELQRISAYPAMGLEVREAIAQLLSDFGSIGDDPYEAGVYGPTRAIVQSLNELGCQGLGNKIREVLESGFTALEIFMGLRVVLKEIIDSRTSFPQKLRAQIERLYQKVESAR